MPQAAISERPEGYVIEGTGEVVAYQDRRLKDSPDGEFHWCSVAGKNDGKTICLFVPPRSYLTPRRLPAAAVCGAFGSVKPEALHGD